MPVQQSPTSLLAHELRETVGRLVRRLRAEPGPSVGRLAVLGRLDRDGPSSISDLAGRERMRPQSMAQTVHELETGGLVSRRPDPADGRRAFIELTPQGLQVLQITRARRETWLTEVLERELNADERELLYDAVVLLSRIADAGGGVAQNQVAFQGAAGVENISPTRASAPAERSVATPDSRSSQSRKPPR
jgi:DNA-binding MarR family transcriptional regulator